MVKIQDTIPLGCMGNKKIPLLTNNQERYKFVCLFNWLDKKLEITEYKGHNLTRSELQKYVITNYFDCKKKY